MYWFRRIIDAICVASVMATAAAGAGEHREHGAHVHGIGHLNVVLDGAALEIELNSPALNLVGFEYAPRTDAEHKQYDEVMAQLRDNKSLFVLPDAAGCKLTSVNLSEDGAGDHAEEEALAHHHEDDKEHQHSDINVYYRFHCGKPALLGAIDVQLFQRFPSTEKLELQSIGPNGQKGGELTADDHYLRF